MGKIEIANYTLQNSVYIKEIDAMAHTYTHNQTKAKVLFLENEDDHKSFMIGFRTPPADSTGVPHIIEHSVLCGSRKFPLKDPFVSLAKGSLNTYLNAMTYPDKTLYPIASQNDADFHNLMDVYLDAVFFPNIYQSEHILMQEGWRYHTLSREEPLTYKGVVYNEMKGAFSSPEELIFRKIKETLFPDTTYSCESGGAPEAIVDLSYEDFLNFHKQYYHPSNSYISLYGKMDIEKTLTFIHDEYLSHFEYEQVDSNITVQESFEKPVAEKFSYSVSEEKDNSLYLSYNCVMGDVTDRKTMVALSILEYLLLDTPASPIKKALLKEEIGEDVFGTFQTHLRQPIFSVIAKNVRKEKVERFYELIEETINSLITKGIPKNLLKGAIQVKEFELRENDFKGYSKGLLYSINSMKSWLYDKDPTIYLQYEDILAFIHENKEKGYFEGLLKQYFINNKHVSKVELHPVVDLDVQMESQIEKKLAQIKASWSEEELDKHIEKTKAFNAFQEEVDTKEALESIPLLKKEDLETTAKYPRFTHKQVGGTPYIVTPIFTNKIAYIHWYVDLEGVQAEDASYLGMLVAMLGKLDTQNYSYEDFSTYTDEHIGGIGYHIQSITPAGENPKARKLFSIKSKALVDEIDHQLAIMKEVLVHTEIKDEKRILEIIREIKSIMEMDLSGDGHRVASARLLSHLSASDLFEEQTKGLTFYQFICKVEKEWSQNHEQTLKRLNEVYTLLQNQCKLTVGLTVDEEVTSSVIEKINKVVESLPKVAEKSDEEIFEPTPIKEALVFPGNVNYVAMGANFKQKGYAYHGSMLMLKSILSMEYLWQNVRVKNGAYGCFADFRRSGSMLLVSYRDPNVLQTLDVYRNLPDYIKNLELSERELNQYLIGTISQLDFPYTPSTEGASAQMYYLIGITKEELQNTRNELFETTNKQLQDLAALVEDVLKEQNYCVFGHTTSIEQNKDLFETITKI
jgi:hypothetical protein